MKWKNWFGTLLSRFFSPQYLVDFVMEIWPQIKERIPREQRVIFLGSVLKKHLKKLLEGLNREERAALMNIILPIAIQEFPLTDLDLLTAFPCVEDEQ